MHIAYEFVYSHITWFLEVLLVLFMGTASISVYQLNNYNHTVAEVLSRYGGLTPQAANNLEHEHNMRYGNMFSVTTPDGKRTGQTVPYGVNIYYTIHPKIPFFNTYINAGVNEHVASEVRQAHSMSARTLTYNNQTPFYKKVKQQAALTSNDNSKDQTTQSLVPAGFFMDNLGEQDAVALVGCMPNNKQTQQILKTLTATVQKGDLSELPESAQAKLKQNQVTLSIAECDTLHKDLDSALKALDSALKSKKPITFTDKNFKESSSNPVFEIADGSLVSGKDGQYTWTNDVEQDSDLTADQVAKAFKAKANDKSDKFVDVTVDKDATTLNTKIPGIYKVVLTAKNEDGKTATATVIVKIPFYAIFVIKHADSTTSTPDYDVVVTKFVPQGDSDTVVFN